MRVLTIESEGDHGHKCVEHGLRLARLEPFVYPLPDPEIRFLYPHPGIWLLEWRFLVESLEMLRGVGPETIHLGQIWRR